MSRPPYPHRCLGGDPFAWACRCKATPDPNSDKAARDGWGSGCRVAMEERIADLEHTANAAHDQLADIAALARGEMEPDARSGGAPALGEAWEAVKALRVRAELAEAARDAATAAITALRTYLTRSVADEIDVHEACDILNGLVPGDLALVLKWVDEIDGRPKKPVQIPAVLFHRLLSAGLKDAEGDVLEWVTARVERCAEVEAERDAAMDEVRRLRDLVRHQRGPLHDAELLTDAEYAALAADAGAVARLRGYDEMRRESRADTDKAVAAALEARAEDLDAKADAAFTAAVKAGEAGDEEREDAESARWTAYRVAARIVRGT